MKLEIKEKELKVFKPFSLTIEFETKSEVIALFHQLNIATSLVKDYKHTDYEFDPNLTDEIITNFYNILEKKLEENEND